MASFLDVVRRALRPPLRDRRFWAAQGVVVLLAGLHLLVDLHSPVGAGAFPDGIPVALLILPVGYAALRYGLTGSAATAALATLLWLPDLLLPLDQGHAPSDVVNLVLVDVVALFFGQRIEAERDAHARVVQATLGRLHAEAGYRQLFHANRAPILVLDDQGTVREANPAALALFGGGVLGAPARSFMGGGSVETLHGTIVNRAGRDYRAALAELPESDGAVAQLVLEDVTEERTENRRAARHRALLIAAEEEQRRRIARELHDEPLQLLLHLARRLEAVGASADVPAAVAATVDDARAHALEAATRLRNLAKDLRPPALDQLGFVPALSGHLADAEEESGLLVELTVCGEERRLPPEVELAAFRIVQEAVRNVVRHARAHEVHVDVTFGTGVLELCVLDDGAGLASDAPKVSAGHLGLVGMEERAGLLGGTFEVQSTAGHGTRLWASLPIGPGRPPGEAAGTPPPEHAATEGAAATAATPAGSTPARASGPRRHGPPPGSGHVRER